jgi:hypothetical protein
MVSCLKEKFWKKTIKPQKTALGLLNEKNEDFVLQIFGGTKALSSDMLVGFRNDIQISLL